MSVNIKRSITFDETRGINSRGNIGRIITRFVPSAASPFNPGSLPGLVAWYKADSITGLSDGDYVDSDWIDSSTSGNDLTPTTTSIATWTASNPSFGNMPTVEFGGGGDYFRNASPSNLPVGNAAVTIYVVGSWGGTNSTLGPRWLFGWGTSAGNWSAKAGTNEGLSFNSLSPRAISPGAPFVFSLTYNANDALTKVATHLNGVTEESTNQGNLLPDVQAGELHVASRPSRNNEVWDGHIAEILVYDTTHDTSTRQSVETYLSQKYSIPLTIPNSLVTSGLVVHLDASDPSSYPGTGTTWFDLSGNNKHATFVGSPTWFSSGYFTGFTTSNYMSIDDNPYSVIPTSNADRTVIAVAKTGVTTTNVATHLFSYGSAGFPVYDAFGLGTLNKVLYSYPSNGSWSVNTTSGWGSITDDESFYVLSNSFDLDDAFAFKFTQNGSFPPTQNTAGFDPLSVNTGTGVNPRIGFGIPGTGTWPSGGRIYAIYVYNRALTNNELVQMYYYLSSKVIVNPYSKTDNRSSVGLDLSSLTSIGASASVRGRVTSQSPKARNRGSAYFAEYVTLLNIPADGTYQISLYSDNDATDPTSSGSWDTYMYLLDGTSSSDTILTEDDDAGPSTDSQITTTLEAAKRYTCECTAFNTGVPSPGFFKLEVTRTS
jgi:hypothetical protein